MCYNVSIIDNMAFEKTEDFTLHIIFVETDNVIATVNYSRVYVVDDDGTLVMLLLLTLIIHRDVPLLTLIFSTCTRRCPSPNPYLPCMHTSCKGVPLLTLIFHTCTQRCPSPLFKKNTWRMKMMGMLWCVWFWVESWNQHRVRSG